MKRIQLVLISFIILFFLSGVAGAFTQVFDGNPGDTPAGSTVTAEVKSNYRDINLNPRDLVTDSGFSDTVTAEYGITAIGTETGEKITTMGFPQVWPLLFLNEGNAPFTYTITYETELSAEAAGWDFSFYLGTNEALEIASGTEMTLAEDQGISYEVKITPSTEAADSPDTSIGRLDLWLNADEDYPAPGDDDSFYFGFYSGYTGVNGLDYGGTTESGYGSDWAKIQTPVLTMTRTSTIDSPDDYALGIHDPVPGSLCTVLIYVSNEGTGTADDVVFIDKVPDNMVAFKWNIGEPEDTVEVTAAGYTTGNGGSSNYQNWVIYYTSEANPGTSYDASGWVSLGSPGSEGSIPAAATFVKWQKVDAGSELEPGQWIRAQWSCYIK